MVDTVLIDVKKHEPSRGGGRGVRTTHYSVRVNGKPVDSYLSSARAAAKARQLREALRAAPAQA